MTFSPETVSSGVAKRQPGEETSVKEQVLAKSSSLQIGKLLVFDKLLTFLSHVPMYTGEGNEVFQSLEFSYNQCSVC